MSSHQIITGAVEGVLPTLPDNHYHGIFCDPPYGLSFMGNSWDHGVPSAAVWAEVLRVSRPGAHLLAFGGSRTFHRLVCAVEDAGWEIRDVLMWVYGSGFPKSLDVSKAIDKEAGHWRGKAGELASGNAAREGGNYARTTKVDPVTAAAAAWSGYGTALKPAYEPIILARKPLDGTVAANVQKWGCGAVWIDGGRVGEEERFNAAAANKPGGNSLNLSVAGMPEAGGKTCVGRWPANLLHDGSPDVVAGLGEAARFFYCPKASQSERNAGCEALPARPAAELTGRKEGSVGLANSLASTTCDRRNHHPTVKPLALCEYLSKLILPAVPGNMLVPFSGSGSEMLGALKAGWADVTGVEREAEYVTIGQARLSHQLFSEVIG